MTDLESCFEDFTDSAFRLETLSRYAGQTDDSRFAAYRQHVPLPDRSVRTSPWLRRMAVTTAAGKSWQRVHVVEHPLSEYERFELTVAYVESAAAGEEIRIADRTASPQLAGLARDFWLFDAGTSHPVTALMRYDSAGRYTGSEITSDDAVIDACKADRDLALRHSLALNAYLAGQRDREIEAA
jgi:hypothetical protein